MSKVYIPNKGGHDYSAALRYGEIIYVTKLQISIFAIGTMARSWAEVLKDSTDTDFILHSGPNILTSIGAAMFARKHGCINLLLYRNDKYICRRLMLDDLIEGEIEDGLE